MPAKIICGYTCSNCGCSSVEKRKDCEYYWANFGEILIGEITSYICRYCKCILIQFIHHRGEKDSWESLRKKIKLNFYEYLSLDTGHKLFILRDRTDR